MSEYQVKSCCPRSHSAISSSCGRLLIEKKTVLFVAFDSIGHINSLIGIANALKKRGHRTVFLFLGPIDCGLRAAGHEVYDCTSTSADKLEQTDPAEFYKIAQPEAVFQLLEKIMMNRTSEGELEWLQVAFRYMMSRANEMDEIFARKLALIKPDSIILDQFFIQPAILKSGVPWSTVYSASPLALHPKEHQLAIGFTGLPTHWLKDESISRDTREKYLAISKCFSQGRQQILDEWLKCLRESHGIDVDKLTLVDYVLMSPNLNVYFYPKELDYDEPLQGWHRCDSILRNMSVADLGCTRMNQQQSLASQVEQHDKVFEVPDELKDKPGKLIFLSMGTLACNNVSLMKRLVEILAKSPHRFVVSQGPKAGEYALAPNMWGQKHVDQLGILQVIDMIITHGGNNTITECFYFGVPGFIVCPAFGDQMDNARRIEECKLGKTIDPLHCSEQDLLEAIDKILADETIRPRMKQISERMQLPENRYRAIELFSEFVEGHK